MTPVFLLGRRYRLAVVILVKSRHFGALSRRSKILAGIRIPPYGGPIYRSNSAVTRYGHSVNSLRIA